MATKPTSSAKVYAVLTGDVISSTTLAASEMAKVRSTIRETVRAFVERYDPLIKGAEFFQGDSWQVLLGEPRNALRLALLIQAHLVAKCDVRTRVAIGIGRINSIEKSAAISTGEAFTLSGHELKRMNRYFDLTGAVSAPQDDFGHWFTACLRLLSPLMGNWTRRQAEVMGIWLSLPHPTHEAVAANLNPPIAKQSVTDILSSANWRSFHEVLKAFNTTDWQHIAGPKPERTT